MPNSDSQQTKRPWPNLGFRTDPLRKFTLKPNFEGKHLGFDADDKTINLGLKQKDFLDIHDKRRNI